MFPTLFAIRTSWLVIFPVVIGLGIVWFLARVATDFATWFKEEVIDDMRDSRRKRKEKKAEKPMSD